MEPDPVRRVLKMKLLTQQREQEYWTACHDRRTGSVQRVLTRQRNQTVLRLRHEQACLDAERRLANAREAEAWVMRMVFAGEAAEAAGFAAAGLQFLLEALPAAVGTGGTGRRRRRMAQDADDDGPMLIRDSGDERGAPDGAQHAREALPGGAARETPPWRRSPTQGTLAAEAAQRRDAAEQSAAATSRSDDVAARRDAEVQVPVHGVMLRSRRPPRSRSRSHGPPAAPDELVDQEQGYEGCEEDDTTDDSGYNEDGLCPRYLLEQIWDPVTHPVEHAQEADYQQNEAPQQARQARIKWQERQERQERHQMAKRLAREMAGGGAAEEAEYSRGAAEEAEEAGVQLAAQKAQRR